MRTFHIGGIHITPLKVSDNLEMFEVFSEDKGLGPGLHFHKKMEESFYILEGKVTFTIDGKEKIAAKGEFFAVPKLIVHQWKIAEKRSKLLLLFAPSQNQIEYFTQLEKLQNQGDSWQEAITTLSAKFDNTPQPESK